MKPDGLVPGEIVVVVDPQGYWVGVYEYVGVNADFPGEIVVRDRKRGSSLWRVRAELVSRPRLVNGPEDSSPIQETAAPPIAPPAAGDCVQGPCEERSQDSRTIDQGGITAAQRRCLFAMAKAAGLDIDDLRAATPLGSISALTRVQAADLIDRLAGGRGMRPRPQGTATSKQLGLIAHLRDAIGFSETEFSAWLSKRFHVEAIDQITDKGHASRIIGGLLKMKEKREAEGGLEHVGRHRRGASATVSAQGA